MTIGALTSPTVSDDAPETRLEFPDNRLLIELFGEFNRNLTQIEAALDVQLVQSGQSACGVWRSGLAIEGGRRVERALCAT